MGFKKNVIGILAAAALTLSMFGGVAARPSKAELVGTQCDVGPAFISQGANFGTWEYNGVDGYELVNGSATHTLNVNVTKVPAPGVDCDVEIDMTTPLTNGTDTIPNSRFAVTNTPPPSLTVSQFPAKYTQGLGEVSYYITLSSVPGAISTGTYNGTLTHTVSNGA